MARPVIITCAVTGGALAPTKTSPHVPVTAEEIVAECLAARAAGAAVVHIHVRDPETRAGTMALARYRDVMERLRASGTDAVINLTTGPGAIYIPSEDDPQRGAPGSSLAPPDRRVEHIVALKPEICSLDAATMNQGDVVFLNAAKHLRRMAEQIRDAGVKPELEAFDIGHVHLARELIEQGYVVGKPLLQLCLGVRWGAPATAEAMMFMRDQLPPGAAWAGFGVSRAQFPMVAAAVVLGGHVRVGLEDNLYLERGVLAPGNAPLVERAAAIVRAIGERVATPAEAREILELG